MQDIFCDLAIELNISQAAAKEKACALFIILDTDKNGLIDALEMFSALAAISGMRLHEIFDFALSCYDFDGIQELTVDEVTLALKSLSVGLSKLSNLNPPSEEVVEQLVTAVSCCLHCCIYYILYSTLNLSLYIYIYIYCTLYLSIHTYTLYRCLIK